MRVPGLAILSVCRGAGLGVGEEQNIIKEPLRKLIKPQGTDLT